LAWGAGLALCRPQRNRLKIGLRREGTVSDDLLETRRLTRTDGGDPAYICLVARRGGDILVELSGTFQRRLNFPAGQQNHPWDQYRARRCRLPTPDTQSGRCCRCSCVPVAVQISSHRRAWRCLLVPGARRPCSFSFNCRHRP